MKSIDFLEHGGGFMHLRLRGDLIPLADPRALHYQRVLLCLQAECVPDMPEDFPLHMLPRVFPRWRAAWDLPLFNDAQRLAYLVDHYRGPIAHDLRVYASSDLGELWRARRWSMILDILDRLPAHSWYSASISMDEDHAKMMAEALAARERSGEESKDTGPSLTSWTPEVAVQTSILDAVRDVQYTLIAVNSEKGKSPEPPKRSPRPITPLEKALKQAEFNRRKAAHEALVARVLPKKRPPASPVH